MSRGSCLFNAIGNPDLRQSADPAGRRGGGGRPFGSNAGSISARNLVFVRLLFTDRELGRVATKGANGRRGQRRSDLRVRRTPRVSRIQLPESSIERKREREREGEGEGERNAAEISLSSSERARSLARSQSQRRVTVFN